MLNVTQVIRTGANMHPLGKDCTQTFKVLIIKEFSKSAYTCVIILHPATFFVKGLPVGICWEDLSRMFPGSETQLTPAFIGGGRVWLKECLLVGIDMLASLSAVSETPRAVLTLFTEAANQKTWLLSLFLEYWSNYLTHFWQWKVALRLQELVFKIFIVNEK